MDEYKERQVCAICESTTLHPILRYGSVPLAGNFPSKEELYSEKTYNLDILFCDKCSHFQTDSLINAETNFKTVKKIKELEYLFSI